MDAIIDPGYIKGSIHAPSSKSMMQRICAAALLHNGKTTVANPGKSADDKAAIHIIQQLGASITYIASNTIEIRSNGIHPLGNEINCGESGLSARLFIPIVSLSDRKMTVNGQGGLLSRPMHEFQKVLPFMNVTVESNHGYLPYTLQGPLQPHEISIDGSVSSQFLTGLLFAIAYSTTTPVKIEVSNLKSKPYIDLTLSVLNKFGYNITHENYSIFRVSPVSKPAHDIDIKVEGDWSSAAYWLVAGAIAGSVTVRNLEFDSQQADKQILNVLQLAGAHVDVKQDCILVKRGRLTAFEFDATHCPDLFPILAILAGNCRGESSIRGIHRLLHKESNRAESIVEMLEQFGIFYSIHDDTLSIEGRKEFEQASIDPFNDHRIAMAAAIGALKAIDTVIINNAECVDKSYPDFFADLHSLGVECFLTD